MLPHVRDNEKGYPKFRLSKKLSQVLDNVKSYFQLGVTKINYPRLGKLKKLNKYKERKKLPQVRGNVKNYSKLGVMKKVTPSSG